jgi:hypothetical protein
MIGLRCHSQKWRISDLLKSTTDRAAKDERATEVAEAAAG